MAMTEVGNSHWAADGGEGGDEAVEHVAAEMGRAAVAEFIGMERSLRAAAEHRVSACKCPPTLRFPEGEKICSWGVLSFAVTARTL